MTTSTLERRDTTAGAHSAPRDRAAWNCENCSAATPTVRKRCADCGTSRY